jgi:spore coat protein U-like protein
VSATVVPYCTFNTNGALAFGFLDPSAPVDVNGVATQPTFVCSPGTAFNIVDDGGLTGTYTMTSGANSIPYSFTYTNAGVGTGLAVPMNIAGTVLGADYATALPGIYTDVVTLTITP